MRITHQEAMTLAKQRDPRAQQSSGASPELLRQAVVAMENLTGLPEWDVFLQRIQAFVDDERRLIAAMVDNMPATMTNEQILAAHRRILESKAKVEAWERVLSLPKSLLSASPSESKAA